jgi:hypothetical protein
MVGVSAEKLHSFAEDVIGADWQGTRYQVSAFQHQWFDLWCKNDLLLILAARGHGKTETTVVLPILWLAAYEKDILIYIISVSQEQANKILGRIKRVIERQMPWLIDRKNWAKQEIKTTGRVSIVAKGFMTSIIGPHPQYIFVDDPIEDQQSYSDSSIESWFFADLFPMLAKNGKMLVIGTYKHYGDLFHAIQSRGLYSMHVFPAQDEVGKLLWPEYWTTALLEQRRAALGSLLYSREYMLKPVDDSSSMLPRKVISECFDPNMTLLPSYQGNLEVYVGIDVATSGTVGADYTVFTILGNDPETADVQLLNLIRRKGLTLQEHLSLLAYVDEAYRPVHVKVEKNAFQVWLQEEAETRFRDIPITGHNTGKEKSDMREGVPSLGLMFERKQIAIPRGRTVDEVERGIPPHESEAVKVTEVLVHELNSLTFVEGKVKSVAKHDDTVMSLWMAVLAMREGKVNRGLAISSVDTGIHPAHSRRQKVSQITRRRVA